MKKFFYLCSAFALTLLTGCQENEMTAPVAGEDVNALESVDVVASVGESTTRTYLGESNQVFWDRKDAINLFYGYTSSSLFTVKSIDKEDPTTATLTCDRINKKGVALEHFVGLYPYDAKARIAYNEPAEDGGVASYTITTTFPSEQSYKENSFAMNVSPMMAVAELGKNLSFKNMGAAVRINLKGLYKYDKVTKIEVYADDADGNPIPLAGDISYTMYVDGSEPKISLSDEDVVTKITLDCGEEGVALSTKEAVGFIVVIPPMAFEANQLKFRVYNGDMDTIVTKETGATYERSKITNVGGPHYEVSPGSIAQGVQYNKDAKLYRITGPEGLKWLAATANAGEPFEGCTVKLMTDIDLGGKKWTPIGLNGKRFNGTFDGQGHTIRDYKISTSVNGAQAALFGDVAGATIKNLIIEDAQILYPEGYTDDFYGAAVVSQAYGIVMEGVTVRNSTIQGNNKVAAILAHDADPASMIMSDCHVFGCTIETKNEEDGGNVGGIVGSVNGQDDATKHSKSLTDCSVKNTLFNVVNSSDSGKRSNGQMVGTVIATAQTVLTLVDCVVDNNTFNQSGVDKYVTPYDGIFVGGARTDETGKVIINGVEY